MNYVKQIFLFFFLLFLIELTLELFLKYPSYIPPFLARNIRHYYLSSDRSIIQYDSNFSKYDDSLFYSLKKGTFNFKNREFDTRVKIDDLGFRNRNNQWENVEYAFLGDSFTFGWGVSDNESYVSLLQKEFANINIYNLGVPSYGTVREIRALSKIDCRQLKVVFVQYNSNDCRENMAFQNNMFRISNKEDFEAICENHIGARKYYVFKHLVGITRSVRNIKKTYFENPGQCLEALKRNLENLAFIIPPECIIVVFSADSITQNDLFNKLTKNCRDEVLGRKIIYANFSEDLKTGDFFTLDEHLNSKGHQKFYQEIKLFILNHLIKKS